MADIRSLSVARPAPFMVDMVRAIRADQKTQTRREVQRPLKNAPWTYYTLFGQAGYNQSAEWVAIENGPDYPDGKDDQIHCPYARRRGDLLWVREPWRASKMVDGISPAEMDYDTPLHYMADNDTDECLQHWGRYRHARFMCRWMSREMLEVVDLRIQRLMDITAADALAEGIVQIGDHGYGLPGARFYHAHDPRQSYFGLWEHINGEGSVIKNPWVWATTFKRRKDLAT